MKIVTIFVAISISLSVLANDGRIQGHIKDAKDEFDLKDVIVQLQNENISTLSTSSGFFDLTEIKYGTYYVIFSRKGYWRRFATEDVRLGYQDRCVSCIRFLFQLSCCL